MSAVVQHYPLCSDDLQGSCDVGGRFRVASGAAAVVEGMCQRYRRLLPRAVWIEKCAVYGQLMLAQRSNRAPWLPCSIHGIYGTQGGRDGSPSCSCAGDGSGACPGLPKPHTPSLVSLCWSLCVTSTAVWSLLC